MDPIATVLVKGVLEAGETDCALALLRAREAIVRRWTGEDGRAMARAVQAEHRNWSAWHLERTFNCVGEEDCGVGEEEGGKGKGGTEGRGESGG